MRPRTALTIAGSDSGGGAGIQADLKTFLDHGVYGMSVITAITAQNSQGVTGVWPVPLDGVRAQLLAVLDDLPVDVIKIGMLGDAETVRLVAEVLAARPARPPIVLDPVMVAKGGASLLTSDAVSAVVDTLVPLATVVTPNLPEAETLTRARPAWADGVAVLYKGGHQPGLRVVDTLSLPGGAPRSWSHPRVETPHTHGTGCTLASAIAANLAQGREIADACDRAIRYVSRKVRQSADSDLASPGGHGPLLHGRLVR